MTIQRMDNVLIVVEDLEAAKAFFGELGMELEGETQVEGPWWTASSGLTASVPTSPCCGRRTVTAGSS
jgi:catechol 2,3-dioxygenase-like lactoylglutathione lyase family enzyme